jgi:DNA-binding transcriptional regulator YiaG
MNAWLPDDIKTLRKALGLSQAAFGERIGVSRNYVYLLEKEVKRPSKMLRILLDMIQAQLKGSQQGKE